MPVLPEYVSPDTGGRFERGLRTYEGMFDRARQRRFDDEERARQQQDRELLRPVVVAEAEARAAEAMNRLSSARDQAKLRALAAESDIEGGERFNRLHQIDAIYADPSPQGRAQATQVRKEALRNYLMDFGSFGDTSPQWQSRIDYVKRELSNIVGAEEFAFQERMKQERQAEIDMRRLERELLIEQIKAQAAAAKPMSPVGQLQYDLGRATDPARRAEIEAAIRKQGMVSQRSVEVGPNGTFIMREGPQELTVGAKTAAQNTVLGLERSVLEGYDLLNNLSSASVGIAGNLQEAANKVLPQVGAFSAFDPNVASARNRIRLFNEGVMKMLTSDSRFTDADAKRIKAMLPDSGTLESLPNAQQKVRDILDYLQNRLSLFSRELGRPDLLNMSPEELSQAVQADPSLFPLAEEILQKKHGYTP